MFDEDSMPVPCSKCGSWFDLNDGVGSDKWFPNEVICEDCSVEERKEIERDEEIEESINSLDDALCTVLEQLQHLKTLGVDCVIDAKKWKRKEVVG